MDPVAHAQALIDAWHKRLAAGESARPSPTIAMAIVAEYERLDVYCDGCSAAVSARNQLAWINTQSLREPTQNRYARRDPPTFN
jgi:hypothetical protein